MVSLMNGESDDSRLKAKSGQPESWFINFEFFEFFE